MERTSARIDAMSRALLGAASQWTNSEAPIWNSSINTGAYIKLDFFGEVVLDFIIAELLQAANGWQARRLIADHAGRRKAVGRLASKTAVPSRPDRRQDRSLHLPRIAAHLGQPA